VVVVTFEPQARFEFMTMTYHPTYDRSAEHFFVRRKRPSGTHREPEDIAPFRRPPYMDAASVGRCWPVVAPSPRRPPDSSGRAVSGGTLAASSAAPHPEWDRCIKPAPSHASWKLHPLHGGARMQIMDPTPETRRACRTSTELPIARPSTHPADVPAETGGARCVTLSRTASDWPRGLFVAPACRV
jgi:hypothetical protein